MDETHLTHQKVTQVTQIVRVIQSTFNPGTDQRGSSCTSILDMESLIIKVLSSTINYSPTQGFGESQNLSVMMISFPTIVHDCYL